MAQITNGLVSVENGSATVLGTNTTWQSDNVEPGNLFGIVGDNVLYEVASVTSNTQLQLTAPYAGDTAEDIEYVIAQDFTEDGFVLMQNGDRNTAAVYSRTIKRIQEVFSDTPSNEDVLLKSDNLQGLADASAARDNLGLGTVATKNVGTGDGNVMEVGAFGVGKALNYNPDITLEAQHIGGFGSASHGSRVPIDGPDLHIGKVLYVGEPSWGTQLWFSYNEGKAWFRNKESGKPYESWKEFIHSGNTRTSTGNSVTYPMTQKAVTDALNTKVNTSTQVIAGAGLSGGGNLSANRTLSVDSSVARLGTGDSQVRTNSQNESKFVTLLPDITALASLNTSALVGGQQFSVGSYLPNTSTGSCLLRWRPDLPKSRHDGVLFFSLTVPMFTGTDTADYRNGVGETDPGGNGVMELVRGEIIYSVTSLIPSYYPTLQESIVDLDGRLQSTGDVVISHRIEAGHRPTLGVVLANKDYSRHRLVADDAEVLVAESFPADGHFLFCENGTAPRLSFLVNMGGKSAQDGAIYMLRRGHVRIDAGCGAIYSGTYGLHLNQCSSATAHNGVFHHAVQNPEFLFAPAAVQVQRSSELTAEFLDCTDSGNYAVTIRRMSTANIRNCDGRRAATKGLYVIRSRCFFQFSDFSEAGEEGVLADQCSQLSGDQVITDNCGGVGIYLRDGTTGDLRQGSSSGNGADGVMIVASGVVDLGGRVCDGNANDGLFADRGSQVNHRNGSTNNNGRHGTTANEGSTVNRRSGTSTGNTNNDLHIDIGSTIVARLCETTNGAGTPDVSDTPVGSFNAISARGVIYA